MLNGCTRGLVHTCQMTTLVKTWQRLWFAATVRCWYQLTCERVCCRNHLGLSSCPSTFYSNLLVNNLLPCITLSPVFFCLSHPSTISPSHSPCFLLLPLITHFFTAKMSHLGSAGFSMHSTKPFQSWEKNLLKTHEEREIAKLRELERERVARWVQTIKLHKIQASLQGICCREIQECVRQFKCRVDYFVSDSYWIANYDFIHLHPYIIHINP